MMNFILVIVSVLKYMQNSPYYISAQLIGAIDGEEILDRYEGVEVILDDLRVVEMMLEVTSHRLLFRSKSQHSFLIKGENIHDVGITESGFFSKEYHVKMHTQYGKVKLGVKQYNQVKLTIEGMINKKAWTLPPPKGPEKSMYTGMFNKIKQQKDSIQAQSSQISGSFKSFDTLFSNLRDIKKVMNSMKEASGQTDGDNPEVKKILKDMGFVADISKDEAGHNFSSQLAVDLVQVCEASLFKNYGGIVPLLDLFYYYNKKRQMNLLAPEEVLEAAELFPKLGLHARVVRYPNNIIMVQSTSLDEAKDFQDNYARFFKGYQQGVSAQEVARRKGLPTSIVQIKLKKACRKGKLAVANRIEGTKYYKNMFMSI